MKPRQVGPLAHDGGSGEDSCRRRGSTDGLTLERRPGQLSTEASSIKELPGDEANDVVFESRYGLRVMMLNRPKKLNSLNGSMIRKMLPRLLEWEKSDMAQVVVVKGAGDKAFCAGGDVAVLAQHNQEGADGWKKSAEYFELEYKLDHYIATYQKPYVALMDGITMGGGVGLSIHAPFRVATERTVFAMPETTIGFFPDVGASFFLPRMNGAVGTYLALTSERLTGANVFYSGLATHYLHSTSLADLEARLAELRFGDEEPLGRRLELINDTLEEFCTGLPYDQPMQIGGPVRQAIDRCFGGDSIEAIIKALEAERGETEAWARKQVETLKKRSPTAVVVTLQQMREGKGWDIGEAFRREHQMASKFMQHPDFSEGVTALLVRKEAPRWQPASLEALGEGGEGQVAGSFLAYDDKAALELLTDRTYSEYPHGGLGVPTEREVEALVRAERAGKEKQLVRALVASRKGRQGMAEVVEEVLARKTTTDAEGRLRWVDDEAEATAAAAASRL